MQDEELRNCIDLCFYRFEKATEDLKTANNLFNSGNYRAANNRAYYSIFHSLRTVLALDHYDSKKHSGIISEFRRKYMKNRIFPTEMSGMIDSAFEIRNASDYNDMFIADKSETQKQIENAEYILKEIEEYIGLPISAYKELFEKDGKEKVDGTVIPASKPNLRFGSRGTEVKKLQTLLNNCNNAGLVVDGIFGKNTRAALVAFQKNHDLVPDGIYGGATAGRFSELLNV